MFDELILATNYETAMQIKNTIIFFAGLGSGLMAMFLLAVNIMLHFKRHDDLEPISVIKAKQEGKDYYLANPKNFLEACYIFSMCLFLSNNKPFRRTRDASKWLKPTIFSIVLFFSLCIVTAILLSIDINIYSSI